MKVLFGIVHNDESVIPAREVTSKLGTTLTGIEHFEVSKQVLDSYVDFHSLTRHALAEYRIERRWRRYRQVDSVMCDIKSATGKILKVINLVFSESNRIKAKRIRQIETAVTNKHLKAWEEFRNSSFEFLLVMEADATWTESQRTFLARTIESLSNETPAYLSISGGLDMEKLRINMLINQRESFACQEVLTFCKPVTNTSCAYIINRPLVDLLLAAASAPSNATWKQLPIDWYMNSLFIHLSAKDAKIVCKHFNPPLLLHGSMTGTFASWHPERK